MCRPSSRQAGKTQRTAHGVCLLHYCGTRRVPTTLLRHTACADYIKETCMAGIPVLTVEGDCIARAWENALVLLHRAGCDIKTQYDKPDDPPSRDATMIVTVHEPLAEPMIHRDFPGGFEELQEYVMEVCEGIKDHCVRDPADPGRHPLGIHLPPAAVRLRGAHAGADRPDRARLPAVGRHARIPAVPRRSRGRSGRTTPATTRRVCRASGAGLSTKASRRLLCMNVRFRSNDAYKAAFMNMFALTRLQARIAARIAELFGPAAGAGPLLPHGRQFSHLRIEPGGSSKARFLGAIEKRTSRSGRCVTRTSAR